MGSPKPGPIVCGDLYMPYEKGQCFLALTIASICVDPGTEKSIRL